MRCESGSTDGTVTVACKRSETLGSVEEGNGDDEERREWVCWCRDDTVCMIIVW